MAEMDPEEIKRYSPQHPLPEEIQKMERDETICRYCGVSYLIHSEIKALEKKLKSVEKELEHYKGCQEREDQLKQELQVLQDQRGEFEMTITVKDAAIATLTNNLRSQETISESLRNQKDEAEHKIQQVEKSNKELKDRNNHLERNLPSIKFALHQQKLSLEDIHRFVEMRDQQMKAEMEVLLQHVATTCDKEVKEKQQLENQLTELKTRWGSTVQETEEMKTRLEKQEEQIRQLDKLFTENKNLKEKCAALENASKENEILQAKLVELEGVSEKNKELEDIFIELELVKNKYKQLEETIAELEFLRDKNRELEEKLPELECIKEKHIELLENVKNLESAREKNKELEQKLTELECVNDKNSELQENVNNLESVRESLQKQFDEAIEKCRSLQLETHQFKEQFKNKTSEVEELTTIQRRKEQALEMTMQKLKSDLQKRDKDLVGAKREMKELQNKLEQQQQQEADLSRQTAKYDNETKDLKESFFRAKEEIENLKEEREAMITSHQNRIEQLRASFKEKLAEADSWQEKLDAAIQKEKERHAKDLQELEKRLKESFVMELEIEKGKYRELMRKYQSGSQETEEKLRAQLQSIESRYKAEINDLNELLAESRRKSREMEDELRREIVSLKSIIKDLEARLARLDVGNEDLVMKLKTQLRETHQELEETRQILDKEKQSSDAFQEEVKTLQETVQKECEERFELTEALSAAKEELLHLKKPSGGYSSVTPRRSSNASLPPDMPMPNMGPRRSISEPSPVISNPPAVSKPHTYSGGVKREYTLTNSNTMVFTGDNHYATRPVGGSTKRTGGSLAENRRRIAAILGRK